MVGVFTCSKTSNLKIFALFYLNFFLICIYINIIYSNPNLRDFHLPEFVAIKDTTKTWISDDLWLYDLKQ